MLMDLMGYLAPKMLYCLIDLIDSTTKLEKKVGSALISLLDMDVFAQFLKAYSPIFSTETESLSSMYLHASLAAILNPLMIFVGWTFIFMS